MTNILRQVGMSALVLGGALILLTGCARPQQVARIYRCPYPQPKTFAVTIFRNLSGSEDIDVMAVTDAFYAELKSTDARNFQVVPVNRVLATLVNLGLDNVNSPADVALVADALAVDAVIVGAVTQYDPYFPPRLGMSVQLFLREDFNEAETDTKHVDARKLAQAATNFTLQVASPVVPKTAVDRIIDAKDDLVVARLIEYAQIRSTNTGPAGWKKYATTENYPFFVSHEIVGELLALERDRLFDQHLAQGVDYEPAQRIVAAKSR